MSYKTTFVGDGGRIVIPKEIRKELQMVPGEKVTMRVEGGELRIMTVREGIRRAQEWAKTFIPEGVSLVDELIAERRAEAERE